MARSWTAPWKVQEDAEGATQAIGSRETQPESGTAQAGGESKLQVPMNPEVILEAIREVEDPELMISIVELGLVYGVEVEGRKVRVTMTLTSPGCPIGPMLQAAVTGAVYRAYPDAEDVKIDLVWSPPWDPYKMASEEAKDMLGIW